MNASHFVVCALLLVAGCGGDKPGARSDATEAPTSSATPSGETDAGDAPGTTPPWSGIDSGPEIDAATPPAPTPSFDFSALEKELFGGNWQTEGVVVQHAGAVVYEKYAAGFDATRRHITYSASKSVGGALIGIAVDKGLLKLDESICKYVPAPSGADASFCDTKLADVLQMASGLKWEEGYDNPLTSDVLTMLYGNEADMGLYVAKRPRAQKAGSTFLYSSGDANLLALALKNALSGQDMRAWAKANLFDPAGMTSALFEADRSGTLVFSSSCFLTVRDMARFGQLFLDDGMSGATRVLPSSWVAYTQTPSPATKTPTNRQAGVDGTGGAYGAAFWLNAATPNAAPETLAFPDAPPDMYGAQGHWGQKIFIVPSRKLVVARVGNDRAKPTFDSNTMMKLAVSAIDAGGTP